MVSLSKAVSEESALNDRSRGFCRPVVKARSVSRNSRQRQSRVIGIFRPLLKGSAHGWRRPRLLSLAVVKGIILVDSTR
jgi:hypothetical protein